MSDVPTTSTMTTAPAPSRGLDDVMLAMDVVDTLRHRQHVLDKELNAEGREKALVARLREIYKAQGIEVPDSVLREGVKALEERRFLYTPPKPSLAVRLAKLYVARDRWLKPVVAGLAALVLAGTAYQVGVAGPKRAEAAAITTELRQTLPDELVTLHAEVVEASTEPQAIEIADAYLRDGQAAIESQDITAARDARTGLMTLGSDLKADYNVTIVSRPGELSGVFRIPDDVPGVRNYYLIVEAIDARGRPLTVTITSEEDQKTKRVTKWGVRVPERVFEAVAADKGDDQIIQNAVIGRKAIGRLTPEYTIPTEQGAIVEW